MRRVSNHVIAQKIGFQFSMPITTQCHISLTVVSLSFPCSLAVRHNIALLSILMFSLLVLREYPKYLPWQMNGDLSKFK